MLYRVLQRLFWFINRLYFVEVQASGLQHFPAEGPVILAANHPGSILDTILMGTFVPRPIHFLARSGLFRVRPVAWLFRQLGAVPIYRSGETPGASQRNRAVFSKVFELLEEGGCIGIFPEGANAPRTQVAPLRTGTARMALGFEEQHDFEGGLVIVPVGINFTDRDFLTAAVLLRFGPPIEVAGYEARYATHPQQTVESLTADVQRALQQQAMHIDDMRAAELAEELADVLGEDVEAPVPPASPATGQKPQRGWLRRLWTLAARWYQRSTPETQAAFKRRMLSRKYIYDVLQRALHVVPGRIDALRIRVERYRDHLQQRHLRGALRHADDDPVRVRLLRLRMTLYAVLMAPIVMFGFMHNAVPYFVTKLTARRFEEEAIRGFAYFALGILAFGLTYVGIGFFLWRYTEVSLLWSLLYVALLPPTGLAVLTYRRTIVLYRNRILVRTFLLNQEDEAALLREERQMIAERFEQLAATYSP
ncbi:MAG: hypothetical protein GVY12_03400 [Bacteroidetes bacterium]|jgi:1-acyl-sn-glycerol-3-phosphate acyltransferase|nr:hypothetical protein [Bacteroidota bacterium]